MAHGIPEAEKSDFCSQQAGDPMEVMAEFQSKSEAKARCPRSNLVRQRLHLLFYSGPQLVIRGPPHWSRHLLYSVYGFKC